MKQSDQETAFPIQQAQAGSTQMHDSATSPISDEEMSDLVSEFFNRLMK